MQWLGLLALKEIGERLGFPRVEKRIPQKMGAGYPGFQLGDLVQVLLKGLGSEFQHPQFPRRLGLHRTPLQSLRHHRLLDHQHHHQLTPGSRNGKIIVGDFMVLRLYKYLKKKPSVFVYWFP